MSETIKPVYFQCGTRQMGTLYWSKDGMDLDLLPTMNPVTEEQLQGLEVEKDSRGSVNAVKVKNGRLL